MTLNLDVDNDPDQFKSNSSVSPPPSILIVKKNSQSLLSTNEKLFKQESIDVESGLDDHLPNRNFKI